MATTIKFQEIFSRFPMKIEGYYLFDPNISNEMRNEIFSTYIHSATSATYIRRLFNVVWISDPVLYEDENGKYIVDGLLEFSMNYEVEKPTDASNDFSQYLEEYVQKEKKEQKEELPDE